MGVKRGDSVRQIVKVIEGTVAGFQIDNDSGEKLVLVEWSDGEDLHSKYFLETEIELVVQQ